MRSGAIPVRNGWIAAEHGAIGAAWFWPRGASGDTAVLVVPSLVNEERTMCGGIVALGHALADAGLPALLIDLHGTLQSAGTLAAPDIGERWRADIRRAVAHLRESGFAKVIVVGTRVGSLLAFDALADDEVHGIVAWVPILAGKRYVREVKVLQGTAAVDVASPTDQVSVAGFDLPRDLLEHLGALDTARLARVPTRRLLVLDTESTPLTKWIKQAELQGVAVERIEPLGTDDWLTRSEALPVLPFADIGALVGWCLRQREDNATTALPPPASLASRIEFDHGGRRVRETAVEIGPDGLCGVLSEPADVPARGMTMLLLSSVGPGRAFTNFARDEAARGRASLRFDMAGFGTSDRRGGPPGGEVYELSGRADVVDAVAHLYDRGHQAIAMLGFCANAWSMVHGGPLPGVRAVMALNVALYVDPGRVVDQDPLVPLDAPKWLSDLVGPLLLKRIVRKLRRIANFKMQPVGWLEQLCAANVNVALAFSEHDLGQTYVKRQLNRMLRRAMSRGLLELHGYQDLGHLLENPVARAKAFDDLSAFMRRVEGTPQAGLRASANAATAATPTPASTSSSSR